MHITLGRIVHITFDDGTIRPAIVNNVHEDGRVFISAHDEGRAFRGLPYQAPAMPCVHEVAPSPSDYAGEDPAQNEPGKRSVPGFWHWPPRA